eukprot:CAMPEP_0203773032 /NCGR_PEP_ID=MMETSP0099_2-20121227/4407_1 /ASSEMBLY_ACC=CAM_ASM_000209 /TAXON_ID=96639 /ORGANISM=" , Strain NY0313808BC1" /LENGTH=58 /DNA_ID=CAMNT_0050670767 /DNA_START=59 /DNA_END=235 /DNA_ORIENTATION=+
MTTAETMEIMNAVTILQNDGPKDIDTWGDKTTQLPPQFNCGAVATRARYPPSSDTRVL